MTTNRRILAASLVIPFLLAGCDAAPEEDSAPSEAVTPAAESIAAEPLDNPTPMPGSEAPDAAAEPAAQPRATTNAAPPPAPIAATPPAAANAPADPATDPHAGHDMSAMPDHEM